MNFSDKAYATVCSLWGVCLLLLIVGWGMNLYTILVEYETLLTGELVVRSFGVLLAPLGGVMGYF